MIADKFIDLDLSILEIPEGEKLFWDECKVFDSLILLTKFFKTVTEMSEKWESSVHFTAGYIQNNLELLGLSDDSAWDVYIVFLCMESIPDDLRLKIEQNKFCCKKYVIAIREGQTKLEAINKRLPLFCQWPGDSGDSISSVVNNNSTLRERLADGLNSQLADILRSSADFDQIPTNDIVNTLLQYDKGSL